MKGLLASLRGRMLLVALLATGVLLAVLGVQLASQFERHVERQQREILDAFFEQLILSIRSDAEGRLQAGISDGRFSRPLSGYYWQINGRDGTVLARSRSLWDEVLQVPAHSDENRLQRIMHLEGPGGQRLFALVQRVSIDTGKGMRPLIVIIAREHAALTQAVADFRGDLVQGLGLLALLLIAALLAVIGSGLKPLNRLREQVMEVMRNHRQRVDVKAPRELEPLVTALNRLLDAQQRNIERSRRRAAELAHGLKTPLAVLSAHARQIRELGHEELAARMEDQLQRMEQIVRHELTRARMAGQGGEVAAPTVDAAESLRRLRHALQPVMQERGIECSLEIAEEPLEAAIPAGDFLELFGNVMENACKWARSAVRIIARRHGEHVIIEVQDDGPGIPDHMREEILEPGRRLDESREGQGLGLAIVRDIAAEHGLKLQVGRASLGGLLVRLELPCP